MGVNRPGKMVKDAGLVLGGATHSQTGRTPVPLLYIPEIRFRIPKNLIGNVKIYSNLTKSGETI